MRAYFSIFLGKTINASNFQRIFLIQKMHQIFKKCVKCVLTHQGRLCPIGPISEPYTVALSVINTSQELIGQTEVSFDIYGMAVFENLMINEPDNSLTFRIEVTSTSTQEVIDFVDLENVRIIDSFVPDKVYHELPDCSGSSSNPDPEPEGESLETDPLPESEGEGESSCPSYANMNEYNCATHSEGHHPLSKHPFGNYQSWHNNCLGIRYAACDNVDQIIKNNQARCGTFETCSEKNSCECSLSNPDTSSWSIEDYIEVSCFEDTMTVLIDKCALNSKGKFSLSNTYLGGNYLSFQPFGSTKCHGKLAYTDKGTVYKFELNEHNHYCGSNMAYDENNNSYSFENILQSFPNDIQESGILDNEILSVKLSCGSSGSSQMNSGSVSVQYEGLDNQASGQTLPPQINLFRKSYTNNAPEATSIYILDQINVKDHLIWDITLDLSHNEKFVLTAQKCWLSVLPDPHWVHLIDLISNKCPNQFVNMIENAESDRVKFNVEMDGVRGFLGSLSEYVFIHCQVRICDIEVEVCGADCLA